MTVMVLSFLEQSMAIAGELLLILHRTLLTCILSKRENLSLVFPLFIKEIIPVMVFIFHAAIAIILIIILIFLVF